MSQFPKTFIGAGIGIAVWAISASYWPDTATEHPASPARSISDANPVVRSSVPIPPYELVAAAAGRGRATAEPNVEQMVQGLAIELREEHGHEVENLRFQISLMGLRDELISSYPAQGEALFFFSCHPLPPSAFFSRLLGNKRTGNRPRWWRLRTDS